MEAQFRMKARRVLAVAALTCSVASGCNEVSRDGFPASVEHRCPEGFTLNAGNDRCYHDPRLASPAGPDAGADAPASAGTDAPAAPGEGDGAVAPARPEASADIAQLTAEAAPTDASGSIPPDAGKTCDGGPCSPLDMLIYAGVRHACLRLPDGKARCWGWNSHGQLGNGSISDSSRPVDVMNIEDASGFALGGQHTCGYKGETVMCWGWNSDGQLGNGTSDDSPVPVPVVGLGPISPSFVDAGLVHNCALLVGGAVACWGSNLFGQLGDGSTVDSSSVPVMVKGVSNAIDMDVGDYHSCAVINGGAIKCWGRNDMGQLGIPPSTSHSVPVVVRAAGPPADAIYLTRGQSCVSRVGVETLECWGPIAGIHLCISRPDGSLQCEGDNTYGQLGDGTTTPRPRPVTVLGLSGVLDYGEGLGFTCAVASRNSVWCWGLNDLGQLGNGTTINTVKPVRVAGY
jgi:alpha-tubulin suppressor-like RCC1 family protein